MPPKEEQVFIQSQSRLSWVSAGKDPRGVDWEVTVSGQMALV